MMLQQKWAGLCTSFKTENIMNVRKLSDILSAIFRSLSELRLSSIDMNSQRCNTDCAFRVLSRRVRMKRRGEEGAREGGATTGRETGRGDQRREEPQGIELERIPKHFFASDREW
jgi:hypothetical protein